MDKKMIMYSFQVAYVGKDGSWDIVGIFQADGPEAAQHRAQREYGYTDWFLLIDGTNVNYLPKDFFKEDDNAH